MSALKAACLVAALLGGAAVAASSDIVVIVNKDGPVSSLSGADVKRLYTGRMSKIEGTKMVPINQPLDSAITDMFLSAFVDMSVEEFREYWVSQQVRGGGAAPMIQRSADAVKAVVAQVPGAVGYVRGKDLDDTVKAVRVK